MTPDATDRAIDVTLLIALGGLITISALAVNISVPATALIASELATDSNRAQLIVTVYLAGLGLGQIPSGIAADRHGRRRTAIAGMAFFTLASLVCALSPDFQVLIWARFLQGFSASVGLVVSRAAVRDFAQGKRAAHLMALLVTILTVAPLLAPGLGSLVILLAGWRGVFWVTGLFGVFVLMVSGARLGYAMPVRDEKGGVVTQFAHGVRRVFSEPQCLFGLALVALPSCAYLAFITSATVVTADLYQVSAEAFGFMFSVSAAGFLIGVVFSRRLVRRVGMLRLIRYGAVLFTLSAVLFILGLTFDFVTLLAFWIFSFIFMLGGGFIGPNAVSLALDPVPDVAGRAAAITGTVQLAAGTLGSFLAATFYDGTLTAWVGVMALCALGVLLMAFAGSRLVKTAG